MHLTSVIDRYCALVRQSSKRIITALLLLVYWPFRGFAAHVRIWTSTSPPEHGGPITAHRGPLVARAYGWTGVRCRRWYSL